MKTAFVHIWDNPNVGDRWCSPKSYFPFENSYTSSFGQPVGPADLAIYGGGQVFPRVAATINQITDLGTKNVVWAVGLEKRHLKKPAFRRMARKSRLISSRNKGIPGCEWVPCVSAMSDIFDEEIAIEREVALFSHATKSDDLMRVDGIDEMSNYYCTMEDAIRFIGSAETVVTNSYHGTYWAMCLGRKVLCVPFSGKFSGFEMDPVKARPQDWIEQIHLAEAREGVLENARQRNQVFYEQVMNL